MKLRIATWNLNTWLNRRDKGITNTQLWQWADTHLGADVVVFTEAETPPPSAVVADNWTTAHRPLGFPGVSKWGTVIAGRTSSNVHVRRIAHVGSHELDTQFPGTFTAADLFIGEQCVASVVGLHLRYRKNKDKEFIGHPESDLDKLKKDFVELLDDRGKPLIVAGDFNYDMEETPRVFNRIGKRKLKLVDAFENQPQATFEQDWGERNWFRMDYMFLSKMLDDCVTYRKSGNIDFSAALTMSDHSPLLIEIDVSDFL